MFQTENPILWKSKLLPTKKGQKSKNYIKQVWLLWGPREVWDFLDISTQIAKKSEVTPQNWSFNTNTNTLYHFQQELFTSHKMCNLHNMWYCKYIQWTVTEQIFLHSHWDLIFNSVTLTCSLSLFTFIFCSRIWKRPECFSWNLTLCMTRLAQLAACPHQQMFSKCCPQNAYVEF